MSNVCVRNLEDVDRIIEEFDRQDNKVKINKCFKKLTKAILKKGK